MALKIRLRQQGRTNRRFYRIVVMDSRTKRDGKYVESLGWYNPYEKEDDRVLTVDTERVKHWVGQGAQMTEKVEFLVSRRDPQIVKTRTQNEVARRAKAQAKRKEQKKAAAK